jgi:hypothetical protein
MNAAQTTKLTKAQAALVSALRQDGVELAEHWGIDRGATGLCCRGYYHASLTRLLPSGARVEFGRPLQRRTVSAIRSLLTVRVSGKGSRISRLAS